ncbi:7-carboxy-7-deazaguanine synthase QueE [Bacillus sp. B15-48]|uniref:7-carboxy-7-deazaguanine synthase QueE n=1 Tax=Bacillus sp. B15-48 TaxID=1548601 RepID=UPI00193F162B|nr:7-carboxy-7-deazaguanine synthase QueE [Bacillus sp. B15-48]MBM4765005.1 7-carboxy-7-deazaguanine synthase QueE [Bacillus sp. B15-48]
MNKIPVMEIFGPTIQGEGMVIGQKTMFVRTAGCDYSCSWCDSAFTWDGSGKHLVKMMTAEQIWDELKAIGGNNFSFVTISGGNPALLQSLDSLIKLLKINNIKSGLETQGSKWQDWFYDIDQLTISPKPPSSLMKTDMDVLENIVFRLANTNSDFSMKVVVFDDEDLAYAKGIHKRFPDVPFYLQVGNEDSNTDNNVKLVSDLLSKYEWLINKVIETSELNNVKVLPQLHTLVWGNRRGV